MAMSLVSTVTVGSGGAASIEFTGIPSNGKDLLCVISMQTSKATGNPDAIEFRFNGNTGSANYLTYWLEGTGSTVATTFTETSRGYAEHLAQHSAYTANTFGNTSLYVSNYASSAQKSVSIEGVTENNATASYQVIAAHKWNQTTAISSLLLYSGSNTILQHSTASLYIIS